MTKQVLILSALLLSAGVATPAAASVSPVRNDTLGQFIGSTVFGTAYAPLGVVSAVNEPRGEIAVVGRHGEVVTIATAMLVHNGWRVYAPDVSPGEFVLASNLRLPITEPTVRVIE